MTTLSWLLAACVTGPTDLSQITDTRVMAMIANPPEARPRETVQVEIAVADPKERGVELLVWACTAYESGCIEAEVGNLAEWVEIPEVVDGGAVLTRKVPAEASTVLDLDTDTIPARLWALACEPGLCPVIDEVREALVFPDADHAELEEALADPSTWMVDLPVAGVSLATKAFSVSERGDEERNQNPIYDPRFVGCDEDPLRVPRDGELEIAFAASDPNGDRVYGYAYTTRGSFEDRTERVNSGAVRFYLLAPSKPREGEVFVIFDDASGGSALYRKAVLIE